MLARDGVRLREPRTQSRVLFSPGSRAELLVRCAGDAEGSGGEHGAYGEYELRADALPQQPPRHTAGAPNGAGAGKEATIGEAEAAILRAHVGSGSDMASARLLTLVAIPRHGTRGDAPPASAGRARAAPEAEAEVEAEAEADTAAVRALDSPIAPLYSRLDLRGVTVPLDAHLDVHMLQGAAPIIRPTPPDAPPPVTRNSSAAVSTTATIATGWAQGGAKEGPAGKSEEHAHRSGAAGVPQPYSWYGMADREYDGSIMRRVALGAVEEWTLRNERALGAAVRLPLALPAEGARTDGLAALLAAGAPADTNHPFHLHVNHFQIIAIHAPAQPDGADALQADRAAAAAAAVDYEVGDWRDTITVPTPGSVTVRWRADDFTGVSMAHCHIFGHSDTGMSMDFEIVPAAD